MKNSIQLACCSISAIFLLTLVSACGSGTGKAKDDKAVAPVAVEAAEKYSSADGKFKINFEGKPTVSNQKVPTEVGDIEVHMFIYEKSATEIFLVGYSDYPSELIKKSNVAEVIKGAQSGVVSELKAKITEEKNINVGGNDGIWFRANSDQYYITYKLFLCKNRLYQIGMVRDGSHVTDETAKGFMDTFELVN
jgi:hypothetical protein